MGLISLSFDLAQILLNLPFRRSCEVLTSAAAAFCLHIIDVYVIHRLALYAHHWP